ncbi:MAG: 50S ribosomal protein L17 [bacterium]
MRHRKKIKKLGRPTGHRVLMLRNQQTQLFKSGKLETTEVKARATKRVAEKTLTIAKQETLAAKRQVRKVVNDPVAFRRVFEEYVPRYKDRPGGYVSLIKLPPRRGDAAKMAILTLLD